MTRRTASPLLLAGSLHLVPPATFAQAIEVEEGHATTDNPFADMAAGTAIFVVFIVAIALFFATLRERSQRNLIARFVDKGQEIPPSLLPQLASPHRELRRGVWLTSLGVGLGLVLYISTGDLKVAAWCLIFLFLGIASFINAVLFYPKPDSRHEG